jgi:uncharacterized protein DUF1707
MPENYPYIERPRTTELRASDSDRDAIAEILREHHLAGRLQTDEFQDRLDRCYDAKTHGQLDELVADLPRPEPKRPAARAWRWPAIPVLALVVAAVALSHGHLSWLVFPLFFFVWRPLFWRRWGPHTPPPVATSRT